MAHRSRAAGHEDVGALERPVREQALVRGQRGNAETRAELVGHLVRERDRLFLRDDAVFGGSSPRGRQGCHPQPYPLPEPAE